jgi:murein DD-endopeptidase MepM/ murein hydrolase activator NlpD
MLWSAENRKPLDYTSFRRLALLVFTAALTAAAVFAAVGAPKLARPASAEPVNSSTPAVNSPEPVQITPEPAMPPAFAVIVNGSVCAVTESESAARSILDAVLKYQYEKARKAAGNSDTVHAEFLERISIKPVSGEGGKAVMTSGEAYAALTRGEFAPKVKTTVLASRTENIAADADKTIIPDGSIPENTRLIVSVGRGGLRKIDSRTVYVNGKEVLSQIISETVIAEPVDFIIRQGAAKLDKEDLKNANTPDPGSLAFIKPVSGKTVKAYGLQKGRMHFGLDIECAEGSEVAAPESGRVVLVMERDGYGLTIDIDHGNGFISRCANLKKAKVSYGETVAKGDVIALSDKSGSVHFELRSGGAAVDPEKYLQD